MGPKRLAEVAHRLEQQRKGAGELLGADEAELRESGVSERHIEEAKAALSQPPHVAESVTGARILSADDEAYPRWRLRAPLPLPVVLYVHGNIELLSAPGVAIAGARAAPTQALEYAAELAAHLAKQGLNVVSGHAAGIDEASHAGALMAGGTITAVLAEGIDQLKPRATMRSASEGSVLYVSGFAPRETWTPHRAMERNTTIAALSDAVVVVASGLRGGSFAQGELCLKAGKKLLVPDFPEEIAPGNSELIGRGAVPVDHRSPAEVLIALTTLENEGSPGSRQLRLLA